jgi:hypothetical protein
LVVALLVKDAKQESHRNNEQSSGFCPIFSTARVNPFVYGSVIFIFFKKKYSPAGRSEPALLNRRPSSSPPLRH